MKAPADAPNENLRLETLRFLKILDTQPEERFDRLTRLASKLFDVPIALISLVDEQRQWFKSSVGLSATETPRNISFCGHAILGDDVLVVPDTILDDRFYDNPLVTGEPRIRFYAGSPLSMANGSMIGTICLIDSKPRVFNDQDRALLSDLSKIVTSEIAAMRLITIASIVNLPQHMEAEENFRLVTNEVSDYGIFLLDKEGIITSWNTGAERIKGYKKNEILGKHFSCFYTPEDIQSGKPANELKAVEMHGRFEDEGWRVRKDGSRFWANLVITAVKDHGGKLIGYTKITRDITDRKKAEERFRLMVEAAPNAMLMVSREGKITLVNAQTEKLFGYPREELIGQPIELLVPIKTRPGHPRLRDAFFASPRARSMGVGRDLYGVTKQGAEVPVEIGLNPIETPEGFFTLASIIDITERKKAEERFRLMVEAAPNAMLMVSREGKITLINTQTEKLFGYPREELIGQPIEILVPIKTRPGHPQLRDAFFAAPRARSMGVGRDLYGMTKDGKEVPVEIGLNPIETPEGLFTLASIIDITERKKIDNELHHLNASLEAQVTETHLALSRLQQTTDQLVQAEKMASLGGLVAGVAHEINTPIGIGLTAASHLQDEMILLAKSVQDNSLKRSQLIKFTEIGQQSAQMVLSNLNRAADLIRSFKQVAVDQSSDETRRFNLSQYIGEILASLHPKLRHTAHRIDVDCDQALQIETVPGALSQILTNLILNSLLHAYELNQAGVMKISASIGDGNLVLMYSDDGRGIPSEMLPKIFDPFFTTKRGYGGTGLGLNIVFNLVHNVLSGTVNVTSTLGKGTVFTIIFPVK